MITSLIAELNTRQDVAELYRSYENTPGLVSADHQFFRQYKPGNVLIVYGSLAPGKSNHSVVAGIKGDWQPGIIKGQLENKGWAAGSGFPAFRPAPADSSEIIDAWVLTSEQLPVNWAVLDEFEGDEYRRILSAYELKNGFNGAGYIYALNA